MPTPDAPDFAQALIGSAQQQQVNVASTTSLALAVQKNGATVAAEQALDFEDGTGLTWTVTDDAANGRVKVTPSVTPMADLAYVTFSSTVNCTATTEATANSIVSAGAVTFDGTAVWIEFWCPFAEIDAASRGQFALYDGSSSIGILGKFMQNTTLDHEVPIYLTVKITPSAGSHTYSVRAFNQTATLIVGAGAGSGSGALFPGYIRITKAP